MCHITELNTEQIAILNIFDPVCIVLLRGLEKLV